MNVSQTANRTRRQMIRDVSMGMTALAPTSRSLAGISETSKSPDVRHSTIQLDDVTVFYREAGRKGQPALLLLHGFANSSHYFRHLMPLLSRRYHLIAPDLPFFGFTTVHGSSYKPTFEQLTGTMQKFVDALGLDHFGMYVFDYGAPIGFNLAVAAPQRVTAIISQNGNVYEEGLSEDPWAPLRAYWKQPSEQVREGIKQRMSLEAMRATYFHGVPDPSVIEPEAYWLDAALLAQPGMMELQVDLKLNYNSNFARYGQYQRFLREHQPQVLAIWGRNDPFFVPAGAHTFHRDVPQAKVTLLDTGHFALETHVGEIAAAILAMAPSV